MATYSKPLILVGVYDHDGNVFTFEDTPVQNSEEKFTGDVNRYGSNVKSQILRGEAVDSISTDDDHVVIPYHSVVMAVVTSELEGGFPNRYGVCMTADEGGSNDGQI